MHPIPENPWLSRIAPAVFPLVEGDSAVARIHHEAESHDEKPKRTDESLHRRLQRAAYQSLAMRLAETKRGDPLRDRPLRCHQEQALWAGGAGRATARGRLIGGSTCCR